ncbi:MAG: prepilin-type N-terminal cleavage/methylation domain-containing protein [Planctomycetota bacterium]
MMRSALHTCRSGFTLLEIMVVLVILSVILGLGVGVFSKVGSGPEIALSRIRDVVYQARFHAKQEKAPSAVIVDTQRDTVTGLGWKGVGCWHFEEVDATGSSFGFPEEVVIGCGVIRDKGVIGSCLEFSSDQDSKTEAFIPNAPSLDSVDGIAAECYVYLLSGGACRFFSKGTGYALGVNEQGYLEGMLQIVKEDDPSSSRVTIDSSPYALPIGRWVKVGLQFNGYAFHLLAGGIIRNHELFPQRMRLERHAGLPISLAPPGPSGEPLNACLDELHLSAVVVGEEVPFHETIDLEGPSKILHFDARGYLDENFHTRPETIEMLYDGTRRLTLTLGMMGELR